MEWTEEHVTELKRLWMDGKSTTQVSWKMEKMFGLKFSRNAIIGKIHRLIDANKMEPRHDYKPDPEVKARKQRLKFEKKIKPLVAPVPKADIVTEPVYGENVIVFRGAKSTATITGPTTLEHVRGCLYAIGMSASGSHLFCNAEKKQGSAYCADHHAKCYIPTAPLSFKRLKKWRAF